MTENSHPPLFFPLCDRDDCYHVLYCISFCDFIPKNFKIDYLVFRQNCIALHNLVRLGVTYTKTFPKLLNLVSRRLVASRQ